MTSRFVYEYMTQFSCGNAAWAKPQEQIPQDQILWDLHVSQDLVLLSD